MTKNFDSIILIFAIIFYSCAASTDTRYSKESEKKEIKKNKTETVLEDDFDISPYKTNIELAEKIKTSQTTPIDVWYGYDETAIDSQSNLVFTDTIPGYRVEVISSDNLDEVNTVRAEVYFKTNEKSLYVIFEPPFYVLRVGDCKSINEAKALSFKLNQLGFSGTKIVNDSILVQRQTK